ncbi:MAG: hypothetical protein WCX63_05550 [Methanoregula sp.]
MDFLAGFTIFIIAFIWVATLIPSLLIGLNAHTIDYDAVAYRTGVILVEDPGAAGAVSGKPCFGVSGASGSSWESMGAAPTKCDIARFGLAVSKDTPGILDENKVDRFFCWTVSADPDNKTTLSYPTDYQKRAIFGDYPYQFNISLKVAGEDGIRSVGDVLPEGDYGYIRRDVQIKSSSNATMDAGVAKTLGYGVNNSENATLHQFSIELNQEELWDGITSSPHEIDYPAYQIDPGRDRIVINITELNKTRNIALFGDYPDSCDLENIKIYEKLPSSTTFYDLTSAIKYNLTINGTYTPTSLPAMVNDSVSLVFKPGAFATAKDLDPKAPIFINLTFKISPAQQYLNNTLTHPFDYNYTTEFVTRPQLRSGVLEVAVW